MGFAGFLLGLQDFRVFRVYRVYRVYQTGRLRPLGIGQEAALQPPRLGAAVARCLAASARNSRGGRKLVSNSHFGAKVWGLGFGV